MSYLKFKGGKILSHYQSAMLIKEGGMPVPRMALFCPSDACNLNCYHCLYAEDNKNKLIMEKEKAFEVIKQLADFGVKGLDLCGGGEPLVTPYALELLQEAKEKGMDFGVITNGVLLKGELMKYLMRYGSYVRVSLDAVDRELYKEMKGNDCADEVMQNLIKASEFKFANPGKCELSVKIGVSKKNFTIANITQTLKFLFDLNIDNISIRPYRQIPDELDEVKDKDVIEGISNYINQKEFAEIMKGADRRIHFDFKKSKIEKQCWLTPLHTVIMADGSVYLCCYYQDRKKSHCIGNILETPFSEIWGSEKHRKAIEGINPGECNQYDCKFHYYNKSMDDFMSQGDPNHI